MAQKGGNIELSLFGQKIVLKHQADDPELVGQVVAMVNQKIKEVQSRAKGAAPHQVTLLALMDLAAEYIQAKSRTEDFKREVDAKSAQLMSWIETELK
jgi:cell division protein ZapA (FtsZ GTPase activity inhibitor)